MLIFTLIIGWVFGYPPIYENFWRARIWQNPPAPLDKYLSGQFPPEIQEMDLSTKLLLTAVLAFAILIIVTPARRLRIVRGFIFDLKIVKSL